MFCKNCGVKLEDGVAFCSSCGTATQSQAAKEPASEPNSTYKEPLTMINDFDTKAKQAFSSQNFLIIAILFSVAQGLAWFCGGFNAVSIAFIVGLWLAKAAASGASGVSLYATYKLNRIVLLISYILNWVEVGIIGVASFFVGVIGGILSDLSRSEWREIEDYLGDMGGMGELAVFLLEGGIFLVVLMLLLVAAFIVIMNVCCYRKLLGYSKEFEASHQAGVSRLSDVNGLSKVLMLLGILQAIAAVFSIGNFMSFLTTGLLAGTIIYTSIWVKQAFAE